MDRRPYSSRCGVRAGRPDGESARAFARQNLYWPDRRGGSRIPGPLVANSWATASCELVAVTHPQANHALGLQHLCPVTLPLESREAALVNVQPGKSSRKQPGWSIFADILLQAA